MKKLLTLQVFLLLFNCVIAQPPDSLPPYKKFPTYPPVKLVLPDSAGYYTKDMLPKKSAVLLICFHPQCEYCKHETEEIVKNIDRFKDVQIVMATSGNYDSMMVFREKFGLAQYDNIVVGHDPGFFLMNFFQFRNMPFLAFYNRKKELISVFSGSLPVEKVLKELKK